MGQYTDKGPGDITVRADDDWTPWDELTAERDELRAKLARARRALDVECGNVVAAPDGWRCYVDMWRHNSGSFVIRLSSGRWSWCARYDGRCVRISEAACALEAMEAADEAVRNNNEEGA